MRKIMGLLMVGMTLVFLTGCGKKLDEGFSEETLVTAAQEVAGYLQVEDFDSVIAMFTPELAGDLEAEEIEAAWIPVVERAGAFSDFSSEKIVPQDNEQATVVLICNHENAKIQLTITFNTDMMLTGLYMK